MPRYRALNPIFIASALYQPGEEFESDLAPGRNWEPLDAAARAAVAKAKIVPFPKMPGEHKTALVEIPEDWESLKPLAKINLARKLGLAPGGKAKDAVELIERELTTRDFAATA